MNNKNYFIFAAAIALASCSVDEYMGENPEFTQTTKENIIGFGGGTGSMSRATSNTGDPNVMLDNQFLVYGWKTESNGTTTQKVFDDYKVWYENNTTASTSKYKGWEYVGNNNGTYGITPINLTKDQYIKYWDYSATDYRFVAGSPISAFRFNKATGDQNAIDNATVTDLAGHINPNTGETIDSDPKYLAVAKVKKEDYGGAVKLDFTRLQTKVRVGIYETIPGYEITEISFYKQDGSQPNSNKHNVILTSTTPKYFKGGAKVKATVNYTWGDGSTYPSYTVEYAKADDGNDNDFVEEQNWYGGSFNGVHAESSNPTTAPTGFSSIKDALYGTDKDMDDYGYFTVLSTTEPLSDLVIKCDFTLTSLDDSGETINVTGATAAIPDAYCKWDENKMYTYIFKISQKTNGTTGTTGDKEGLFPITFDAVATATEEGVETIVQTPSITTHQTDAAVTANGIEYKTGTAIDITVMQDGKLKHDLQKESKNTQGYIAVYKLSGKTTEAQLTVTAPSDTPVSDLSVNSDQTKATFEPSTAGWYAIQYYNGTANFYKVIEVK